MNHVQTLIFQLQGGNFLSLKFHPNRFRGETLGYTRAGADPYGVVGAITTPPKRRMRGIETASLAAFITPPPDPARTVA